MPHLPTSACSPLFGCDGATQHGAAKPTTHAPRTKVRQSTDKPAATPPVCMADNVVATAPSYQLNRHDFHAPLHPAVVTRGQTPLRTNRCTQPNCGFIESGCSPSVNKAVAEKQEGLREVEIYGSVDTVTQLPNTSGDAVAVAAQVAAQLPVYGRPAAVGQWSHQSTWHATTANGMTTITSATSTNLPVQSRPSGMSPFVWSCLSSQDTAQSIAQNFDGGEESEDKGEKNTLFSLTSPSAFVVSSLGDDDDHYTPFVHAACNDRKAAAPLSAIVVPSLSPSAGDASLLTAAAAGDTSTPHWTGGGSEVEEEKAEKESWTLNAHNPVLTSVAQQSNHLVTGTLSSCLPTDGWAPTSLLQSPLTDALQPLSTAASKSWTNIAMQTASAARVDRYGETGNSPLLNSSFSCCSILSPEPEAILAGVRRVPSQNTLQPEVAGLIASENWESKRLRHISAMRRSHNSFILSPSASVLSFSATLHSPAPETRSHSASGRAGVWHNNTRALTNSSNLKNTTTPTFGEARVPYWTSLSPAIGAATLTTAPPPLLPRTFSAPPFQPGVSFRYHTQSFAADGTGAAAESSDYLVRRFHKKSPAPQPTVEDKQRWYVPLSVRCAEGGKSPQVSQQSPWLGYLRGRRFAVQPGADDTGEFELSPTH